MASVTQAKFWFWQVGFTNPTLTIQVRRNTDAAAVAEIIIPLAEIPVTPTLYTWNFTAFTATAGIGYYLSTTDSATVKTRSLATGYGCIDWLVDSLTVGNLADEIQDGRLASAATYYLAGRQLFSTPYPPDSSTLASAPAYIRIRISDYTRVNTTLSRINVNDVWYTEDPYAIDTWSSPSRAGKILSGAGAGVAYPVLEVGNTYTWYLELTSSVGFGFPDVVETSDTYSFTVEAPIDSPEKAITPSPANGLTGITDSVITLSWVDGGAGEPNAATSYDVWVDGVQVGDGITETSLTGEVNIAAVQDHTWRVDSINASGTTTGDEWTFSTGLVTKPYDLERDNYLDTVELYDEFTWKSGLGNYWYDIYAKATFFGSDYFLVQEAVADAVFDGAVGNVNTIVFPAGSIKHGTAYKWKVKAYDITYQDETDKTASSLDASFWTSTVIAPSSRNYGSPEGDDPNTSVWGTGTYRRNMMSCPRRMIAAVRGNRIFYEDRG